MTTEQFLTILLEISDNIVEFFSGEVFRNAVMDLLLASVVLILGWKGINVLQQVFRKGLKRARVDETLRPFLLSFTKYTLRILLFVSVISILGVPTTSLVAALGAAGLAIGLALQGTLSNLAGGVVILLFKPYKIGDFIEAAGYTGKVKSVQIFHTVLVTFEGNRVVLPNGEVSNQGILNYTAEDIKKIDIHMGISYNSNLKKAKDIAMKIMTKDERVLEDPEPKVVVGELAASSINLYVRCNVANEDFWSVKFDLLEKIKLEYDKAGIEIPFPQRKITLVNEEKDSKGKKK